MKKIYLILILFVIISLAYATSVFAANTTLNLSGASSLAPGSTGKMTLHITSSNKIGGIEGVITKSSNITNIKVIAKNGWNNPLIDEEKDQTYNEETGNFIIYKPAGTSSGEIMEIEYTVSDSEGTGKIEIKDITVANVPDGDEEELQPVSKSITIEEQQSPEEPQPENPQPEEPLPENLQPEEPLPENPQPEDSQKDEAKNTTIPSTTKDTSKTDSEKTVAKNTSATSGKTNLPKTGVAGVLIPTSILILCIVGVIMFFRYKKYKEIK